VTNGYILTISRSFVDDNLILGCNRGGQYCNIKHVSDEREPGKAEQRKLDVWLALRDSTAKVFGNLLVSTSTTIIFLTRIFRDILRQGI